MNGCMHGARVGGGGQRDNLTKFRRLRSCAHDWTIGFARGRSIENYSLRIEIASTKFFVHRECFDRILKNLDEKNLLIEFETIQTILFGKMVFCTLIL
jgi:hypothetical protein